MPISAELTHESPINSAKTCSIEIFHDDFKRRVCVCERGSRGEANGGGGTLSPAKTAGNLISARVHSGPSAGDRGAQSLLI